MDDTLLPTRPQRVLDVGSPNLTCALRLFVARRDFACIIFREPFAYFLVESAFAIFLASSHSPKPKLG